MADNQELLTSSEAAKYLGMSQSKFNVLAREGKIKNADVPLLHRRFHKTDLDEYKRKFRDETQEETL